MIDFLLLLLPSFSFLPLLEKIYFFILVWFLWAGRWEYIGICCYLFGSYLTIHGPLRGVSLSLTAGPDEVVTLLLKPSCHFSSPITRKSRRRRNVEKEEEQELWKMESGIVAAGELRQRRHSSKRRPPVDPSKKKGKNSSIWYQSQTIEKEQEGPTFFPFLLLFFDSFVSAWSHLNPVALRQRRRRRTQVPYFEFSLIIDKPRHTTPAVDGISIRVVGWRFNPSAFVFMCLCAVRCCWRKYKYRPGPVCALPLFFSKLPFFSSSLF